jgi:hypothetical protein
VLNSTVAPSTWFWQAATASGGGAGGFLAGSGPKLAVAHPKLNDTIPQQIPNVVHIFILDTPCKDSGALSACR